MAGIQGTLFNNEFNLSLEELIKGEKEIQFKKDKLITQALQTPKDFNELYSAQKYLQSIEKRQEVPIKSVIFDPLFLSHQGFKEKNYSITYEMLRSMSKVHIIKSIIQTRKQQVLSFCSPQPNKYSTGFIIKKKDRLFSKGQTTLTKKEEQEIEYLTEFIINCGDLDNIWHGDSFDEFTLKFLDDSLVLDQGTFEVTRDLTGRPVEYFATDAATFRLADSKNEEYYSQNINDREINNYLPSYVQLYQGRVISEFYPWELCFGIRNPTTDIQRNGYGRSELEDMIKITTSILNADQYNANFFKVGSNPRGILSYKGNMNEDSLRELKQHWQSTMTGVNNMHKLAAINADQIQWINTHESNNDMEYSKYYEFLIKLTCAMYTIDPSEIGFPMSGSSDSKPMFEGSNEARLKYSKDKGLKPLVKSYQKFLNKYIISPMSQFLSNQYVLEFVGIDEVNEETELDRIVKEVGNFKTLNEVRKERDLPPVEGGDIILNGVFMQGKSMAMYGGQDSNQEMDNQFGGSENDLDNPFSQYDDKDKEDNPIKKSFSNYFEELISNN